MRRPKRTTRIEGRARDENCARAGAGTDFGSARHLAARVRESLARGRCAVRCDAGRELAMSTKMQRAVYAEMFGPTTGDRVRLADTDIIIEVEKDFCTYGEEVKFGGGKVIRDGMGQSQVANKAGAVDTVITNALILNHWGIVKADVGLKGGHIAAVGKAGNPDIQPNVTIVIGPGTEVIAAEGKILTAGGFDTTIPQTCPQQVEQALTSALTPMPA